MKSILVALAILLVACDTHLYNTKTSPWHIEAKTTGDNDSLRWYKISDSTGSFWVLSSNTALEPGDYVILCKEEHEQDK